MILLTKLKKHMVLIEKMMGGLLLLVGILTLFEATLTLPGIAGIILTVGMQINPIN